MKSRNIKTFIRNSIKTGTEHPDDIELQTLLDQMSTAELQKFWMDFTVNTAFSKTISSVPDWKTKDRQSCLQYEMTNYSFFPKNRDSSGKNIIVREELEEHIKTHLIKHIGDERELRQKYKNRPVFEKIQSFIGFSVLIAIVPFCVCLFWSENRIYPAVANAGEILFGLLWAFYLLLGILHACIRRYKLRKNNMRGV